MKQTEKIDLVLRALYESPRRRGNIIDLLKDRGVDLSIDDARTIGDRLSEAGYVVCKVGSFAIICVLKSEGIEFVEGNSFTHRGSPVINNNYTISNSPNANLVSHSNQVTINQHTGDEAKRILTQMREAINIDDSVDEVQRQEIAEHIDEVEFNIERGRPPKIAYKALVEVASNISSVGALALQLGQILGWIPSPPAG